MFYLVPAHAILPLYKICKLNIKQSKLGVFVFTNYGVLDSDICSYLHELLLYVLLQTNCHK